MDAYINEFQKIAIMVPKMAKNRVVMLFVEGLSEMLHGLVKAHKPKTLDDAIELALDLDTYHVSSQIQKKSFFNKPKNIFPLAVSDEINELKRKKLCFTCKQPWEVGHRCIGKGKAHLIEVISDDEGIPDTDVECDHDEQSHSEHEKQKDTQQVTMASLSGVSRYHSFHVKGVINGQQLVCIVDSGATHNFIDEGLVARNE